VKPQDVDWARVARPQADGYDAVVAQRLAERNGLPEFGRVRIDPLAPARALLDGRVHARHVHDPCPWSELVNAPLDAPAIAGAIEQLRVWPEIREQLATLIHTIQPVRDPSAPAEHYGSCSGCTEREFGLIYATVEHPVTMAEALVHELAHAKLHALGVGVSSATRLIGNDPTRLYESPVIRERARPMTAVFHALYTFSHILELDLRMLRAAGDDERAHLNLLGDLLAYALVRVEHGLATVRREIVLDAEGIAFMAGYYGWADELIAAGHELLDRHGHPGAKLPALGYQVNSPIVASPAPERTLGPTLLDFRLHEFLRVSWVSAAAQRGWAERLDAVRTALAQLGEAPLADDDHPSSLRLDRVYPYEVAERTGAHARDGLAAARLDLAAERVSWLDAREYPRDDRRVFLLVGRPSAIAAANAAARAGERMAWQAAFARPACCADARIRAYEFGLRDPLWALWFGASAGEQALIEHELRWTGNTLLDRLGLSLLPFVPCHVECEHAAAVAEATVALGRRLGHARELDDLLEVLSWPVAWSTLHGIAEVRTPLFKAVWDSDATAGRHELQLRSSRFPAEAPTGLRFPHPAPRRRFMSDSKRFVRGLDNPLDATVDVALTRLARRNRGDETP
jgi:hypothetical protein